MAVACPAGGLFTYQEVASATPHTAQPAAVRASFALRRPDLLLRRINGKDLIEIDLDEVEPYVTGSPVILEAGARNGTDTVRFAQRWPGATIHTFEPVPELFAEVERRTSHLAQVRRYPVALLTAPAQRPFMLLER